MVIYILKISDLLSYFCLCNNNCHIYNNTPDSLLHFSSNTSDATESISSADKFLQDDA